jgi:hypothetical protein
LLSVQIVKKRGGGGFNENSIIFSALRVRIVWQMRKMVNKNTLSQKIGRYRKVFT